MADPEKAWRSAYRHPGPWDQDFPPQSMSDLFAASAAKHPQAPLLDFMGRRYSYGETMDGANRVAAGLKALGYGRGDRIGLFLPNVPHYVAAYYGILRLGATVVNFSPLYTVDELSAQVADSGTRLLFTVSASALLPTALAVLEKAHLERLVVGSVAGALPPAKSLFYRLFRGKEVARRPDDPRITAFSALIANDGAFDPPAIDPERDLALIQYTRRHHRHAQGGDAQPPESLGQRAPGGDARSEMGRTADRILGVLPFFHVFANTCVLNRTVVSGGEIVMLPRFNAKQVLAELRRTRPRSLPGVPTMFQALLDAPGMKPGDFSSLRFCISGGAPLPEQLKTVFEKITGARVIEGYGLSESSGVVSTNPYAGENKPGTIGQPIVGTRVKLVDRPIPRCPRPTASPASWSSRARRSSRAIGTGPRPMPGVRHRRRGSALAAHRRRRDDRRGRLHPHRRPVEGHDRGRRVQGLPQPDRGGALPPSGGEGGARARSARRLSRRAPARLCHARRRRDDRGARAVHLAQRPRRQARARRRGGVRPSLPKTMIGKLSRKDLLKEVMPS